MHTKRMCRNLWRKAALSLIAALSCAGAHAQEFPTKPVTLVVTAAAGGTTDLIARLVAQRVNLGQPLVIDNRPGGAGSVAAGVVARVRPDGHTLLFMSASHAGLRALYPRLPFDPIADFEPIAAIAEVPVVIAVKADAPFRDIQGLVQVARDKPGALNCAGGSGGSSVTNLAFEMLKNELGLQIVAVPYKGGGPALAALLSGEIDCDSDALPSLMPMIRSNRVRVLAVMSSKRLTVLPQVPTVAETLMPSMNASAWLGVLAPKDTPPAVLDKLRAAFASVVADPAIIDQLRAYGAEPMPMKGATFGKFVGDESRKWEAQIKRLGLTAD